MMTFGDRSEVRIITRQSSEGGKKCMGDKRLDHSHQPSYVFFPNANNPIHFRYILHIYFGLNIVN